MSKYLSQIVKQDMNLDCSPNHVYMDLSMVNNDADSNKPPANLFFAETRDKAIIDNPQEWYITVARFHLDTFSCLPVFIPQIQINQVVTPTQPEDPNLTIYSFSIELEQTKGYHFPKTFFQQYMNYAPQDGTQRKPQLPSVLGKQDLSSTYYYCMNNMYVVKLINQCLIDLYTNYKAYLASVFWPAAQMPNLTNPPWIAYDNASHQMIFNFDSAAFDPNLPVPLNLYCNTAMYNLLNSFEFVKFDSSGFGVGANYKLDVYNNNGINIMDMGTYTALQLYEDYSSCSQWSPVSSIVLCSNTLPITGTIQGAPKVFNAATSSSSTGSNSMKVISDFTVALDNNNSYRPSVDYSPNGIYRMIDMIGHSPIVYLDIQLYWKDVYNNFYPMTIGSGQSCDIKILFRKKILGI